MRIQKWKQQNKKEWGTFPSLQHFGGRGACWNTRMGIRIDDKRVNYSHELTKTKQQVG
jgi:hypothetical protein